MRYKIRSDKWISHKKKSLYENEEKSLKGSNCNSPGRCPGLRKEVLNVAIRNKD